MTDPHAGATTRPWQWERVPAGFLRISKDGWLKPGSVCDTFSKADAALIVYAVNNIERVEQERDEARTLLGECVQKWEPGGGPFHVPMATVNKIVNLLARTQRDGGA